MAYAGFDSLSYPGDTLMAWLKENTNLSFVGFYLAPAPSRPTSGWMGKRATLAAQGWGFAPVYVGQQESGQPGAHTLTAAQGTTDGNDAVQLMQTAGFPNRSVVYLDIEQGGTASSATIAYMSAWVDAVKASNTYVPGVYCSHTTASSILSAQPGTRLWCWNLQGAVPGPNYPPDFPANPPAGCGVPSATVWQWAQNVTITLYDAPEPSMSVDLDCASTADPSKPSQT